MFSPCRSQVGLLDIDLCGPSIPYLLDVEGKDGEFVSRILNRILKYISNAHFTVMQGGKGGGWIPVYKDNEKRLAIMSIGFLLATRNDPVIWRGPKKTSMIRQFVKDVEWDELDYLIVDTPPGTSDEHITVVECMMDPALGLNCDGVVIVTTPQEVSLEDVRKEITFCKKTGINILGIVENMSGYVCPTCAECTNIFSSGGGEALATRAGIPLLGTLPIDPRICDMSRVCRSVVSGLPDSTVSKVFKVIVDKLTEAF